MTGDESISKSNTLPPRPSWKRANQDNKDTFKDTLKHLLKDINIPNYVIECSDPHCSDSEHQTALDSLAVDVLECVEKAAYDTLPVISQGGEEKKNKNIAGWKEMVEPFKDKAIF